MIRKYAENFCWKNVSSFCSAKATHIFSAKNIRILCIESAKIVNEMTLNELVKLTTLWTTGPCMFKRLSVYKRYFVISSPARPLVRFFRNLSGMFPGGLVYLTLLQSCNRIYFETTGWIFLKLVCGCSFSDLVVHTQIWFRSVDKYGNCQPSWIFPIFASPP